MPSLLWTRGQLQDPVGRASLCPSGSRRRGKFAVASPNVVCRRAHGAVVLSTVRVHCGLVRMNPHALPWGFFPGVLTSCRLRLHGFILNLPWCCSLRNGKVWVTPCRVNLQAGAASLAEHDHSFPSLKLQSTGSFFRIHGPHRLERHRPMSRRS